MKSQWPLLLLLLPLAGWAADEEKKPPAIPDALKGKWVLVSTEEGGKPKKYEHRSIVFAGNEYRWYHKDLLVKKAIVTTNLNVKPHAMDLYHVTGPNEGKIASCIFKLGKDTLTIATGGFDRGRPDEFDSSKAACSSVTVWRRQKE